MNILSLFDGVSCGRIALDRVGIKVDKYYASEIDKYAMQVSASNYPDIIQLGDATKWKEWDIDWSSIDLLLAGFPCFEKGTKVITSTGYKSIDEIKIGDMVLTHNRRYRKVTNIFEHSSRITRLKAQGCLDVGTTYSHPYYVRNMTRLWDNRSRTYKRTLSNPLWKEVKDLMVNTDFVGIPIIDIEENPRGLTKELCWLFGRWVADGYFQDGRRLNRKESYVYKLIFTIGKNKAELFEKNITSLHYTKTEDRTVFRYCFSSMSLLSLLKDIGFNKYAINKNIPQEILHLPIELAKSFLEGYISGDGCVSNGKYKATSISKKLCMGLNLLVAKVYNCNSGIVHTKRPSTKIIEGRIVNQKDTYTTDFFTEMKKQSNAIVLDGFIWVPIKYIKDTETIDKVYNIEVEEDNSYIANNVAVHNCQAWSMAGRQDGDKDPRGMLLWTMLDILKHIQSFNPNVKFLFENVKMKKEFEIYINKAIKVIPVEINSALVSAQNRRRNYWTNIKGTGLLGEIPQPQDKQIYLSDILEPEEEIDEKYYIKNINEINWVCNKERLNKKYTAINNIKSIVMTARQYANWNVNYIIERHLVAQRGRNIVDSKRNDYLNAPTVQRLETRIDGKTNTITTVQKDNYILLEIDNQYYRIRKLTPVECERLQTIDDGYTSSISDSQRYKSLGNGWTVDVIAHILSFI